MTPIVWIHGDALRPSNPALITYPDAPAVFVWDDELLTKYGLSFKRIVFMYEALLELPVTIYRGNVVEHVTAFARLHNADTIVTSGTPAPRFAAICQQLRRTHTVEILAEPAFVDVPASTDVKRFSRYWQVAKPKLL
jgi:hypothetical protein